MDERPDETLTARCRDGDRDAYAALVRRHARRVFAICLGMLGNTADSEDAAQEAFVKGLEKIHTLRAGGRFAAWIGQIARNLCRDRLRGRKPEVQLLDETVAAPERRDDLDHLCSALDRLPEKHRTPLLLFYYDGRSTQNLADELQITQAGACTRLNRARHALRLLLDEEAGVS